MSTEGYLAQVRAMTDEEKARVPGETDEQKAEHLKSAELRFMQEPREGVTLYRVIGRKENGNYRVMRADWPDRVPTTTSN